MMAEAYEGINITGERDVNRSETQLNDALNAFQQYIVLITASLRP